MDYFALHAGTCRRTLNERQKSLLETSFAFSSFPNKTTLNELALQTGLSERTVAQWFGSARHLARQGKCEGTRCIHECTKLLKA